MAATAVSVVIAPLLHSQEKLSTGLSTGSIFFNRVINRVINTFFTVSLCYLHYFFSVSLLFLCCFSTVSSLFLHCFPVIILSFFSFPLPFFFIITLYFFLLSHFFFSAFWLFTPAGRPVRRFFLSFRQPLRTSPGKEKSGSSQESIPDLHIKTAKLT